MENIIIYDLLITIYYFSFLPRNQRNPRLMTISWFEFVANLRKKAKIMKKTEAKNAKKANQTQLYLAPRFSGG